MSRNARRVYVRQAGPCAIHLTVYEETEETIRGIARVLMRETGKSMAEAWQEALSLYRVQFETEVLADREEGKDGRS